MNEWQHIWKTASTPWPEKAPSNLEFFTSLEEVQADFVAEERQREYWRPWTFLMVTLISGGLGVAYNAMGAFASVLGVVGVILVIFSGWCLVAAGYSVRIPTNTFALDQPSSDFLRQSQQLVRKRLRNFRIGMLLQLSTLIGGLYLLFTSAGLPEQVPWFTGAFLGFAGALAGISFGTTEAVFRKTYRPVLEALDPYEDEYV
ncbi:MAG: hypothetical protein AAGF89_07920 [Bacteroidota bacterium]